MGGMCALVKTVKPNDTYRGRTAQLTSKRCILYIYSTNISTEYFKHGIYSPFFPLQNAVCFFHNSNVFRSCIIHIYIFIQQI
jgi:hypothetical protein